MEPARSVSDSTSSAEAPAREGRPPTRSTASLRRWSHRLPGGVLLATSAWTAAALVLLARGLSSRTTIEENSPGYTGDDVVATTLGSPGGTTTLVAGFVLLVLCAGLGLGLGWAIYPLVVLGLVATVVLALAGSVLTLVLMAALVLGTVPLLSSRSYAYLTGRRAGATS